MNGNNGSPPSFLEVGAKAADAVRSLYAGKEWYTSDEAWTVPTLAVFAAATDIQRQYALLLGISYLGRVSARQEFLASLAPTLRDLKDTLDSWKMGGGGFNALSGQPQMYGSGGSCLGKAIRSGDGKFQTIDPAGWPPGTIGTFDPATGAKSAVGGWGGAYHAPTGAESATGPGGASISVPGPFASIGGQ